MRVPPFLLLLLTQHASARCADTANALIAFNDLHIPADCSNGIEQLGLATGTPTSLCRMTIAVLAEGAKGYGIQFFPPEGMVVVAELCPATCSSFGVHAPGCDPPAPPLAPRIVGPPLPPPHPIFPFPTGMQPIVSAEDIVAAVSEAVSNGAHSSLYLAPGTTFKMASVGQMVVQKCAVLLASDAAVGATLDLEQQTSLMLISSANVTLKNIRVINGFGLNGAGSVVTTIASRLVLSSCTISNCHDDGEYEESQGAILLTNAWAQMESVWVFNCSTAGRGGFVSATRFATAVLTACTISFCKAGHLGGAAYCVSSEIHFRGHTTIRNCSAGESAGAVYATIGSTVSFSNSAILGCVALSAGEIPKIPHLFDA